MLSKFHCSPSKKESTLKGKTLLPVGANSFLLDQTPSHEGLGAQETKQIAAKVISLVKHGGKSTKCIPSA